MREILFRGKRVDNGEWVEGNFVKDNTATYITMPLKDSHYLIDVDPSTVGQYTGLCDKNGKRIFEGDAIKSHYANAKNADFIETIAFHSGRFCAECKIGERGCSWALLADGIPHIGADKTVYMESFEVIGTIYGKEDKP